MQKSLASCPNLRTFINIVPEFKLFVFDFLVGNLLQFSQRSLSVEIRKKILKDALISLAELHSRGIIHTSPFRLLNKGELHS
jgi:hypothetical protein